MMDMFEGKNRTYTLLRCRIMNFFMKQGSNFLMLEPPEGYLGCGLAICYVFITISGGDPGPGPACLYRLSGIELLEAFYHRRKERKSNPLSCSPMWTDDLEWRSAMRIWDRVTRRPGGSF